MNDSAVGLLVLAVAVVVIGAAIYFNPSAVIRRKLRKVPAQDIGSLVPGTQARVRGTISADGELLIAPLSGRRCAWYNATVSEYRKSGKNGRWHVILTEERGTDFVLRDATGQVKVRMTNAKVASTPDQRSQSGTFDDPSPTERAFLEAHNRSGTGLFGLNRRLQYKERVMEEGEAVTALGRVTSAGNTWTSPLPELVPDPELGLLVSDDPGTVGS